MTIPEYPVDLSILGSYFLLIGVLAWRISPQLSQTIRATSSVSSFEGRLLFLGLAGASFIATWSYMFAYFAHSYSVWKAYYGVEQVFSLDVMSQWLHGVTLFDDAWRTVCTGNWAWLWSIQLCTFTVAVWSPLIAIEGYRRRIPHVWAYMIFGQVVAISTSSALFFAVCLMYQERRTSSSAAPSWVLILSLYLASIGGLITVHYTPQLTDSDAFLPNLLVMHGLLVLPLFYLAWSGTPTSKQVDTPQYSKSYAIIGLYSIGSLVNVYLISQQWIQTVTAGTSLQEVIAQLLQTFLQHPAQSSISSDVVCVYLISVSWMLVNASSSFLAYSLILVTSFLPPSVTLPIYLIINEYNSLHTPISVSDKVK